MLQWFNHHGHHYHHFRKRLWVQRRTLATLSLGWLSPSSASSLEFSPSSAKVCWSFSFFLRHISSIVGWVTIPDVALSIYFFIVIKSYRFFQRQHRLRQCWSLTDCKRAFPLREIPFPIFEFVNNETAICQSVNPHFPYPPYILPDWTLLPRSQLKEGEQVTVWRIFFATVSVFI